MKKHQVNKKKSKVANNIKPKFDIEQFVVKSIVLNIKTKIKHFFTLTGPTEQMEEY